MGYWDEQMTDEQIEDIALDADVSEDTVRAFANHHEGTDFDADQLRDSLQGEWGGTLAEWWIDVHLPDSSERFGELEELANSLYIMLDKDSVDEIAVEQDYSLVDGFVFSNHYD